MNTEDGAKLYDVCPHVSDSVHMLCQEGVTPSVPQLLRHEDGWRLGKTVRQGERAPEQLEAWAGAEDISVLFVSSLTWLVD